MPLSEPPSLGRSPMTRALKTARALVAERDLRGLLLLGTLCSVAALNVALMRLEDLLIPELATIPLNHVVFILGHHRSGTTNLHKALRQHPNLRCGTLLDALAPSLTLKRFLKLRPLAWLRRSLDRSATRRYDSANHSIGLDEEIEEHLWLLHRLRSEAFLLMFPSLLKAGPGRMDDFVDVTEDDFRFVLRCLRRMIYADGNSTTTYLARPLLFTMHVDELLRYMPEARVIVCVREPYAAIRSHGAMTQAQLRCEADSPALAAWVEGFYRSASQRQYRAMLDLLADSSFSGRVFSVDFDALERDTPAVLRRLLGQMGLPVTDLPPARSERHGAAAPNLIARERVESDLGEVYRKLRDLMEASA